MNPPWVAPDDERVPVVSAARLGDELAGALRRATDPREASLEATRRLARAIPFDGLYVLTKNQPMGCEARAGDSVTWGSLTLLRRADRGPFTPADIALLSSLSGQVADGARRAVLLTALLARRKESDGEAGLVLLDADDSIVLTDPAGEAWLAQLTTGDPCERLPHVVAAAARRARAGQASAPQLARARVRTVSGAWAVVRCSVVSGDRDAHAAVTIEPARPHDLAPLLVHAYGLTARERAVTQLVAQGLVTKGIAAELRISRWTVQDHLKSAFEKVGVSTRGELVARVFFEHQTPGLSG